MPKPIPEALPGPRGAPWTVRPLQAPVGFTDNRLKVMIASDGVDATSHVIRAREMIHAAISPRKSYETYATKHGLRPSSIIAAEESRVGLVLRRLARGGAMAALPSTTRYALTKGPIAKVDALRSSWAIRFAQDPVAAVYEMTCTMAAHMHYQEQYAALRDLFFETVGDTMIQQTVEDILNNVRGTLVNSKATVPSWPRVIKAAQILEGLATGKGPAQEGDTLDDNSVFEPITEGGRGRPFTVDWCPMDIETPRLVEHPETRKRMRAMRHTDTGVAIGSIARLLVDERCFHEPRLVRHGTVLIDCSGSMHLSARDVQEMVHNAPAITVGLYAGDCSRGTLRIVARRGCISPDLDDYDLPNGNCVDGPALEWLGTQEGPRIWVSDGIVTGRGDNTADNLYRDAYEICVRHRISRVSDLRRVQGALTFLLGQKRDAWRYC